jgi:ADP-ribose pyrophosphatase YjhB (NUDIX family)
MLLCRLGPIDPEVGLWTLPGGGLAFGESPRDAVRRELEEETGLTGEIEALVEVLDWSQRWVHFEDGVDEAFHAIQIIYRMRVTGGRLRDEVDGSTDTARWFSRAEAEALPLVDLARSAIPLAFADQ